MLDAVTDLYIISTYYKTVGLHGQANAMLAMIVTNMGIQINIVLNQYKKKSWKVKVKEVLICLFFLRPAVDAHRVSTNYKDAETTLDPLFEMIANKVRLETYVTHQHKNIRAYTLIYLLGRAVQRACMRINPWLCTANLRFDYDTGSYINWSDCVDWNINADYGIRILNDILRQGC